MTMREKLIELIRRSHQEEMAFIERLGDAERNAIGRADGWSAKDLLSHINTWTTRMIDNHEAGARGEAQPTYGEIDHENDLIFEATHARTWDDICQEVDTLHRRLEAWVGAMTEDDLVNPERFAWLNKQALWRRIAGNVTIHPLLHLGQFYAEHGQQDHAIRMQETVAQLVLDLSDAPDWRGVTIYNLACAYSLAGLRDKAISNLAEAVKLRPDLLEYSKQDPDFNPIREAPEFQAVYS
jgi:hypothetical protein